MSLITCSLAEHSTYHVLKQFDINLKNENVIHVGAHDGLEMFIYDHFQINRVDWFEANKYIYPDLLTRLNRNPKHFPHLVCFTNKDNNILNFYTYRNQKDGAGSLFLPDKFNEYISDCKLTGESWEVKTITYDTYTKDIGLPDYYFLNLDIQGSEKMFLEGAQSLLNKKSLKWIYCETSSFSVYRNAPLENDITSYLEKYGFQRIGYRLDWGNQVKNETHGDSIYYRKEYKYYE